MTRTEFQAAMRCLHSDHSFKDGLLRGKFTIDTVSDDDEEPLLHYLCRAGKPNLVKILVKEGADPMKLYCGLTAYHVCLHPGVLANLPRDNISKVQVQFTCIKLVAYALSEMGGAISSVDEEGNTALHTAVYKNNYNLINSLIRRRIDINLQNKYGDTAFDLAKKSGSESIKQLLVAAEILYS